MEHQETVHIVLRHRMAWEYRVPVKAFDDRADARSYAKRMNARSKRYVYTVKSVKKG